MNANSDMDTDEYSVSPWQTDVLSPRVTSSAVQVDLAALSHPGKVRPNNEDHYLVVRFSRALQSLLTNLPKGLIPLRAEEVGYAQVVADGMGGMAAGEVASRSAIRTLINLALATPDWVMLGGEPEIERAMERMAERYQRVNAALQE